jgi:hypothetical protein
MNKPNRDLLEDTISEGLAPNSREELLTLTLNMARRRRRLRQTRRVAPALLIVVGLAALLWWEERPGGSGTPGSQPVGYAIVQTEPLSDTQIVRTAGVSAEQMATMPGTVMMIATTENPAEIDAIGDEDLLKLLSPRPVALVRWSAHAAEVVFVNPADREALMNN